MIENLAIVQQRIGSKVALSSYQRSGCARCEAGEGCGGGVFGKLIKVQLRGLSLRDPGLDLRPGDTVVLGLPEIALLRATSLAYLLPLLTLFAAASAAAATGLSDPAVAMLGLLGLGLGMVAVPWLRRRWLGSTLEPTVLRRASAQEMRPGTRICGDA